MMAGKSLVEHGSYRLRIRDWKLCERAIQGDWPLAATVRKLSSLLFCLTPAQKVRKKEERKAVVQFWKSPPSGKSYQNLPEWSLFMYVALTSYATEC